MMVEETMVHQQCINCGVHWMMPQYINNQRLKDKGNFYCPNGHSQAYIECEADKLRRERDRLAQRLAEKDDTIKDLENRRRAAVGQVTKLRNRVSHGVCPCCNRTFENLQRHMASKHPTYAEAAE